MIKWHGQFWEPSWMLLSGDDDGGRDDGGSSRDDGGSSRDDGGSTASSKDDGGSGGNAAGTDDGASGGKDQGGPGGSSGNEGAGGGPGGPEGGGGGGGNDTGAGGTSAAGGGGGDTGGGDATGGNQDPGGGSQGGADPAGGDTTGGNQDPGGGAQGGASPASDRSPGGGSGGGDGDGGTNLSDPTGGNQSPTAAADGGGPGPAGQGIGTDVRGALESAGTSVAGPAAGESVGSPIEELSGISSPVAQALGQAPGTWAPAPSGSGQLVSPSDLGLATGLGQPPDPNATPFAAPAQGPEDFFDPTKIQPGVNDPFFAPGQNAPAPAGPIDPTAPGSPTAPAAPTQPNGGLGLGSLLGISQANAATPDLNNPQLNEQIMPIGQGPPPTVTETREFGPATPIEGLNSPFGAGPSAPAAVPGVAPTDSVSVGQYLSNLASMPTGVDPAAMQQAGVGPGFPVGPGPAQAGVDPAVAQQLNNAPPSGNLQGPIVAPGKTDVAPVGTAPNTVVADAAGQGVFDAPVVQAQPGQVPSGGTFAGLPPNAPTGGSVPTVTNNQGSPLDAQPYPVGPKGAPSATSSGGPIADIPSPSPTTSPGPTGTPTTNSGTAPSSGPGASTSSDVAAALNTAGTSLGDTSDGSSGATGPSGASSFASQLVQPIPPASPTGTAPDGGGGTPFNAPNAPYENINFGNINPESGLFGQPGMPGGGTMLPGGVPGPIPTPNTAGNLNPNEGLFAALNNAVDTNPPPGNLNPNEGIGA